MRRMAMAIVASVAVGAACSKEKTTEPTDTQVFMQNAQFTPFSRTVAAGTTLEFRNNDGINHTVTSDFIPGGAATFDTTVTPGAAAHVTFTAPGTYGYHCSIHGSPGNGMHGTITVN